jgi:molybdate transport system substrate-binding protein
MTPALRIISSMATKQLLADLVDLYQRTPQQHNQGNTSQALPPQEISVESVGGVDATKRVQAGEAFDIVALASNAIDQLITAGKVVAGSRVDMVNSGVAIAVKSGAARPDISSEAAVKHAVLNAPTLGYSTGPSGVQLAKLFERWGITAEIQSRTVIAPPGVPVASLVAKGEVALGFQQLSELINQPGIDVIGPLPPAIQITTTFSAGLAATSAQPEAVRALLVFFASPATVEIKRRNGMEAV